MSPPASMMACRAAGSGTMGNSAFRVTFRTWVGVRAISSPTAASIVGQMIVRRPRLIAFCRKIRANPRAMTTRPWPLIVDAACSRDEPQPKFWPPTMTLPGATDFRCRAPLNALSSAKQNWGVSDGRTVAMKRPG